MRVKLTYCGLVWHRLRIAVVDEIVGVEPMFTGAAGDGVPTVVGPPFLVKCSVQHKVGNQHKSETSKQAKERDEPDRCCSTLASDEGEGGSWSTCRELNRALTCSGISLRQSSATSKHYQPQAPLASRSSINKARCSHTGQRCDRR